MPTRIRSFISVGSEERCGYPTQTHQRGNMSLNKSGGNTKSSVIRGRREAKIVKRDLPKELGEHLADKKKPLDDVVDGQTMIGKRHKRFRRPIKPDVLDVPSDETSEDLPIMDESDLTTPVPFTTGRRS